MSVADPTALRYLAGVPLGANNQGSDAVVVEDTLVYVATAFNVTVVNVRDLERPFIVASYATPNWTQRVVYKRPYVYAACTEAGVLILDTVTTAIGEPPQRPASRKQALTVTPNPTHGVVQLSIGGDPVAAARVLDAAGRLVRSHRLKDTRGGTKSVLDLRMHPSGVYFIEARSGNGRAGTARIIKL
jgi:hypothetical protein